jgi:hypothetical protein
VTDEPTIGEAMRRLDAVSKQMETLARQLAEDRRDFASTYVRHDLYEARHLSLDRRVTLIEASDEDRERDEAEKRRQFTFIVLGVALTAVAGLLVSLVNLLANGVLGK